MDMNSPKKPTSTLWVLEEEAEAEARPLASETHAAVDSLMERLKAKARAHAAQRRTPSSKIEKLVWRAEPISVRVTSQEGLPVQD